MPVLPRRPECEGFWKAFQGLQANCSLEGFTPAASREMRGASPMCATWLLQHICVGRPHFSDEQVAFLCPARMTKMYGLQSRADVLKGQRATRGHDRCTRFQRGFLGECSSGFAWPPRSLFLSSEMIDNKSRQEARALVQGHQRCACGRSVLG